MKTSERMVERVRARITEALQGFPGCVIVVAVSGGVDSMVLFDQLIHLREERSLALVACHVHHGIRGQEADRDAQVVVNWANSHGVAMELVYVDVPSERMRTQESEETAARRLRYQALEEVADRYGDCLVVTAHHQQDQVETIVDHLLRGAGLAGLAGMPMQRPLGKHRLLRPLLDVDRAVICAHAKAQELPYVEDSSNESLRYRRNRIRHELLPYLRTHFNPSVDDAFLRLAEITAHEDAYLDAEAKRAIRELAVFTHGGVHCPLASLRALPNALQRRFIKLVLECLEAGTSWDFAKVEDIRLLAEGNGVSSTVCGHGWIALRKQKTLHIVQSSSVQQSVESWAPTTVDWSSFFSIPKIQWQVRAEKVAPPQQFTASKWEAWFSRQPEDVFTLRPWKRGDRIHPLGMSGSKLLSDIFIDAKVPRDIRAAYPVLAQGNRILWVPGLVRSRHRLATKNEAFVQHVGITPRHQSYVLEAGV